MPRLEDRQDRLSRGQFWRKEPDGLLGYHVAVDQGVVYVCQLDAIRAVRLADGQPRWPSAAAGRTPPASASDVIFQGSADLQEVIPAVRRYAGVPRAR